jgi:hypothetical protein
MPVPDFSPGEVLTAAAMDSIGMWLVKTQTIGSGVTSVSVTDAFSADFDNYKITITGGAAAANTLVALQLGSTNTGYYWSGYQVTYAGTAAIVAGALQANFQRVGFATPDTINANIEIFQPFSTKNTFLNAKFISNVTGGDSIPFSGYLNNTTSYTGFTITTTQALTGGTIRVYGYRN